MPITKISVRGARQHNLKNINVEIPRNTLTVITGLSGSGKSSLAFDTIYAEGQRRYVETLSAYARQFLDQMERPDVDAGEGDEIQEAREGSEGVGRTSTERRAPRRRRGHECRLFGRQGALRGLGRSGRHARDALWITRSA